MRAMLETVLRRGTGRQAALRRFVAGKTGTSSDNRDALFVGFTDQLVVGVWVGNDDARPMQGVSGGSLPALIFRDFILRAQGDEPFLPPATPGQAAPRPGDRRHRRPARRRGALDQGLVRLGCRGNPHQRLTPVNRHPTSATDAAGSCAAKVPESVGAHPSPL